MPLRIFYHSLEFNFFFNSPGEFCIPQSSLLLPLLVVKLLLFLIRLEDDETLELSPLEPACICEAETTLCTVYSTEDGRLCGPCCGTADGGIGDADRLFSLLLLLLLLLLLVLLLFTLLLFTFDKFSDVEDEDG